jgi:hypothetical protein
MGGGESMPYGQAKNIGTDSHSGANCKQDV